MSGRRGLCRKTQGQMSSSGKDLLYIGLSLSLLLDFIVAQIEDRRRAGELLGDFARDL